MAGPAQHKRTASNVVAASLSEEGGGVGAGIGAANIDRPPNIFSDVASKVLATTRARPPNAAAACE